MICRTGPSSTPSLPKTNHDPLTNSWQSGWATHAITRDTSEQFDKCTNKRNQQNDAQLLGQWSDTISQGCGNGTNSTLVQRGNIETQQSTSDELYRYKSSNGTRQTIGNSPIDSWAWKVDPIIRRAIHKECVIFFVTSLCILYYNWLKINLLIYQIHRLFITRVTPLFEPKL